MKTTRPSNDHELGGRPGALKIPANSPIPVVKLMEYDEAGLEERVIEDLEELRPYARTSRTTWIDIQGLGDESVLRTIGEIFGIHELALADAVNIPQRAKLERHEEHLLFIGRAPQRDFEANDRVPQVCLLVGEAYLISFQERYFGFFDAVRARIRSGNGRIRSSGSSYLAYALLDSLVDHYYPVLQRISEELDELEETIFDDPDPAAVRRLHQAQRGITTLRRAARPQIEATAKLAKEDSDLFPEEFRPFFSDVHDHALQIMGRLDAMREMAVDTMSAVLATLGHRQNEVMKVLTLVGSIFIPLTFIAGIYGMNFEHMPELKIPVAYPTALGVMVSVALGMILLFRRKGWIGRRPPR